MKIIVAIVLLLADFPAFASGNCVDRKECWPEESANYVAFEHRDELEKTDKQIAKKVTLLIRQVEKASRKTDAPAQLLVMEFSAQQQAWNSYRKADCALTGAITGAGGGWPTAYALECEVDVSRRRLKTLESAIECIGKSTAKDGFFRTGECFSALMTIKDTSETIGK